MDTLPVLLVILLLLVLVFLPVPRKENIEEQPEEVLGDSSKKT